MNFLNNLTPGFKRILLVITLFVVCGAVYYFDPGSVISNLVSGKELSLDNTVIDNAAKSEELDLPESNTSDKVKSLPRVKLWEYTWNGNSAMIVANGGPFTTEGSLMEKFGVNLEIYRKDSFDELQAAMLAFVAEFDSGVNFPKNQLSGFGVSIMGDGAPYFCAALQNAVDDKFGEGKYHIVIKGAYGGSLGEDKLIGPAAWLNNPQESMKGALISTCVADGDWVTTLNKVYANQGLKVNPNLGTYDATAVNFIHNPDIVQAANDLIASQLNRKVYPLKEIKNGKLTGNTVEVKINGTATWLPGDKLVFEKLPHYKTIASTKEFPNQMCTTLITVKEWSDKNPEIIKNILSATYQAADQMKQYDSWRRKASQCVAKIYDKTPDYWYDCFKGMSMPNGEIAGGTRVMNYADAMQYYGLSGDGIDRYKAVYEQVSNYLVELNPFDFKDAIGQTIPYDQVMDLSSLKSVTGINAGKSEQADYSKAATNKIADGEWKINFATGSSEILRSSYGDLNSLYNLLVQGGEGVRINIVGHTDNTGNPEINNSLSVKRANAVADYLANKGLNYKKIQQVTGVGSSQPIGDNNTVSGRDRNRRVQVTILN